MHSSGWLCCQVQEVCTDGVDNDGDGLVDFDNELLLANNVTLTFWKKSDGEPEASTTVCGVDGNDNRNLNARAPAGDANIYWDVGNDDTSSDNYGEYDQLQEHSYKNKRPACATRETSRQRKRRPSGRV